MEEKTRVELLKSIYEQHWLHARHVENERLWFTNISGLLVAGVLAALGNVRDEIFGQAAIYGGFFLFVVSLVGFFLCLAWRAAFLEHITLAKRVLVKEAKFKREDIPYESMHFEKLKGGIFAHEIFPTFYAFMSGGAVFLFFWGVAFNLTGAASWLVRLFGSLLAVLIIILGLGMVIDQKQVEKEYLDKEKEYLEKP